MIRRERERERERAQKEQEMHRKEHRETKIMTAKEGERDGNKNELVPLSIYLPLFTSFGL